MSKCKADLPPPPPLHTLVWCWAKCKAVINYNIADQNRWALLGLCFQQRSGSCVWPWEPRVVFMFLKVKYWSFNRTILCSLKKPQIFTLWSFPGQGRFTSILCTSRFPLWAWFGRSQFGLLGSAQWKSRPAVGFRPGQCSFCIRPPWLLSGEPRGLTYILQMPASLRLLWPICMCLIWTGDNFSVKNL